MVEVALKITRHLIYHTALHFFLMLYYGKNEYQNGPLDMIVSYLFNNTAIAIGFEALFIIFSALKIYSDIVDEMEEEENQRQFNRQQRMHNQIIGRQN